MFRPEISSGKLIIMSKISYFAPGPAKIPDEVLNTIKEELHCYKTSHVSILEISHRSAEFQALNNSVQEKIRSILSIPSNYKILLLQGGGTTQFSSIPLNLIGSTGVADYFVTGSWSAKAQKEAVKYGTINAVLPKDSNFTSIPEQSKWNLSPNAAYTYYCSNETIHGVQFHNIPSPNNSSILVADMTSDFMTRPIDVSKFGLIFAGAQKNIGCSGVTVVIVREDLIGKALPLTPAVLDYKVNAAENSLYNTPATFAVYVLDLVLDWIIKNGGIKTMEAKSIEKSSLIYNVIDKSNGFYNSPVVVDGRSRNNIPVRIKSNPASDQFDEALEKVFISQSEKNGLLSLKGHRSVGGIRVSLYNAVTVDDARRLSVFMEEFRKNNALSK